MARGDDVVIGSTEAFHTEQEDNPFKATSASMATPKITRTPRILLLEKDRHPTGHPAIRQSPTETWKRLLDNTPMHSIGQTPPQRIGLKAMPRCRLADGLGHVTGGLQKGFELLPGNQDFPQGF